MRSNLNKFKYDWGQGQEVPWQRQGSLYVAYVIDPALSLSTVCQMLNLPW